jgi:type IV pilus assembly protein PilO
VVIMTMHDIQLRPRGADKNPGAAITGPDSSLELAGTVKTYRYLDEEEAAAQEKAAAEAAGKTAGGGL